jgi:hypothetical protein
MAGKNELKLGIKLRKVGDGESKRTLFVGTNDEFVGETVSTSALS